MAQVWKTATYRVVTDSGGGRIVRFYYDIAVGVRRRLPMCWGCPLCQEGRPVKTARHPAMGAQQPVMI